jgi:hypothetical protein
METEDMIGKANYGPEEKKALLAAMATHFNTDIVTTKQIAEYVKQTGIKYPYFIQVDPECKHGWGKYRVRNSGDKANTLKVLAVPAPAMHTDTSLIPIASRRMATNVTESFIPSKDETYVPFGFFNDLKSIIKSGVFYPIYIVGLSGNGKTLSVEQACAQLGREMIRVNITKETDETDLIGSYELIDGSTVRREGPVLTAMRRGAILLLDETDYGSERLLCLQPILEGKGYFDKKTGEFIIPAPGFNVIATANTKGRGSDDGRYIGANLLNEAFLERFAITVEWDYPTAKIEKSILMNNFEQHSFQEEGLEQFVDKLSLWSEMIRAAFKKDDGSCSEIISTRRLVHITKAYMIFKNRRKAIELCLNRFDEDIKKQFIDFYSKIDVNVDGQTVEPVTPPIISQSGKPPSPYNIHHSEFGRIAHFDYLTRKYKVEILVENEVGPQGANGSPVSIKISSHGKSTTLTSDDIAASTDDIYDRVVYSHSMSIPFNK